ncbi:hypothetical protein IWQ62_004220 [Dispira parvispora]|uniref:Uncharacterized protein n=1 Tax=Dispira parvispora TaxID=1520584 RepID=A0A9W8ATA9_9FUNG|nr:hypothetical protein IWQ62_004220 [Dispira parvispora]
MLTTISTQDTEAEVLYIRRATFTNKDREIVNEQGEPVYVKKSEKFALVKTLVEYGTGRELWHHAGKQGYVHKRTWMDPEKVIRVQFREQKVFAAARYTFRYMDQEYCLEKKGRMTLSFDCVRVDDRLVVATFDFHTFGKNFGTFTYLPDPSLPEGIKTLALASIIDIAEVLRG